ncbi:MAG: trypsin-like peptidase domain-containing protein, partial [Gammaproteobacteria bacterium]|nr:trypsin-like peptidase domain-containing protein [Gammaproteobacteria bacterium]
MAIRKFLSFLLQTIMTGLAAAFLYVLLIDPDLLRNNGTVVEVVESPQQTESLLAGQAQTNERNEPVSYADAVEKAAPAVVNIHTAKVITHRVHPLLKDPIFQKFFGDRFAQARKEIQTSLGSGVLISNRGHVLTNNHVIEGADQIQVLMADGRSARAEVVGTDLDTDLAVLHISMDKLPGI